MGFSVKTKFTVKLILTVKYCLHGSHSKERDRRGGKINSRSHAPVRRFDSQRIYTGRVSVSTVSTRFNAAPNQKNATFIRRL